MGNLGGWEILILLGLLVVIFGFKRLPDMARSIGQSARVFKGEMKGMRDEDKGTDPRPAKGPEVVEEPRPAKSPETPGPTGP